MAKLNLKAVEERVAPLAGRESYDREFIFDLLLAYGKPRGNVTRLRNGTSLNVAADPTREVAQKNVVYFRETAGDPLVELHELSTSPVVVKYNPRFVIVTDYDEVVATDTQVGQMIGFPIRDIDKHFTFFLPWAGMEKAQYVAEKIADVKAAERMGKLFDELLAGNPGVLEQPNGRHSLNVFFTRLLFCFFAEDTEIFDENQFTNAVGSHTQADGSDTADFLRDLFVALDTERAADKPHHLAAFPYVNGRLFTVTEDEFVPAFTKAARQLLIELGTLVWREINPDIFGSMFQAIVTPGKRSDLGQHYTSVPNILKTIEPLFMDELREQFEAGYDSAKKLSALLDRISEIKVFDPACGSGNFLIIAYKELRRLEHGILERLGEIDQKHQVLYAESRINIENFFGIEIDDFAVEVAILSLWIAKHQMNAEFKEKFRLTIPLIPLKETGQVKVGNATRVDWNEVCPNDGEAEIYLIGNPPYKGAKTQTKDMKADFPFVFRGRPFSKNLDYIALWFTKGADYIAGTQAELAFVTTNSVAQGEHVGLMFPRLFDLGLEIGYAYTSFKWENNAKRNAGVSVAVISLRNVRQGPKYIFAERLRLEVANINGYLADGSNVFVSRRTQEPLGSSRPAMVFGSMPRAKGLVVTPEERLSMIASDARAERFIRSYVGTTELVDGKERYCLWIEDRDAAAARAVPGIARRLALVAEERRESDAASTAAFADRPHRFVQISYRPTESIIVPSVSSERREYIPFGYVGPNTIISNLAFAVYEAKPWTFALLTSRMHMCWTRAVGGQHETRLRYSNTIVYNNFPIRPLSDAVKEKLTVAALRVLDVREYHCEKTLAELYDPDKMPDDLRAAHAEVDALVDSIYSKRGYETDEQRLSDLFAMYEEMTAAEALKGKKK
ncbi:class I SAM-dependent DNA methyltransferase [Microbacterium esteraromaticum]|uniref:DNA methyltransferase n=1 Tax=Microbacterium esteraromaticum TaxID=57043 RepID=UPI001A8BF5CF|nr:DNA methyltransferase [Microbacterium esteraromaticum]MBN8423093.1 class I SAM-dependent DNA methyltransferase [Microbacterium esteraromaticum]